MDDLIVHLEGIGWWSPDVVDWTAASALLREDRPLPTGGSGKPAAAVLPPNERRRAPEPVRIACEVAAQACVMAARDPAGLPCVFASIHGDLAIIDALCTTLAVDPRELSPTRFHNSVHNAPVGYWTVATGCHEPSSAMSAWHDSLAAGLLEAAVEVCTDAKPLLFVCGDIAARGPLAEIVQSPAPFGAALVLAPAPGPGTLATLRLRHEARNIAAGTTGGNLLANALPLFAALARNTPAELTLPNGSGGALVVEVTA